MVPFWRSCRRAGAAWLRWARTGWRLPGPDLQAAGLLLRSHCLLALPGQRGSTPQVAPAGRMGLPEPRLVDLLVQKDSGLSRGQMRPWTPQAWPTAAPAVRRDCCWESARLRRGLGCCSLHRSLRRDWQRAQYCRRQTGLASRLAAKADQSHQMAQVGRVGLVDQNWEHQKDWLTGPVLRAGRSHFLPSAQDPKACRRRCRHQGPKADQRHFLRRALTVDRMHSSHRPEPTAGRTLKIEPAQWAAQMVSYRWRHRRRC